MDGWSVNTLGHRRPPISSSYPWCNTRLHRGQDFCRSCVLLHLCTCVCGESVPPSPGNLFQTLSCSSRPCSFFHHLLDNLRKQRSENRQRGLMRPNFLIEMLTIFELKHFDLCHTLGRRTPPISSSCQLCSTRRPCDRQDFCRSCARQHRRICACAAFVLTTSGTPVQKLSLLRFPRNLGQINHPRPHSDSLVN